MSSWAQQRESIRRAVEAGASARTSGQGSELLRLPSGQQLLLSRPNGQPTRAGQFYYQLAGRRAPSRRFNENQQLVRDGPNDYIYLRGGTKKLVRSLQPDGNYRVTKLGKSFFRDKWTDYLAHMPVRIRGRRRNGRPYERETLLPVTLDGLGRQNDSLGEVQAHRNVIAAALRKMGDPEDGAVVMEISEETYLYDGSRDWAVSKQTMQVVDNRVETEVALNRRLGVLRDVSYQLFRGSEILESAFEQREDRLCVVRQLSELLRLPYDEVYSDFDAICPKNWERKGVTGAEIREFCAWRKAPLYIVNCRGQMLDCYEPAVREQRPVACCIYRDHAFFYRDGEARDQPSYRGDRRESTVPLFREWKQWRGEIEPGHFWSEDVRVVRAELLGQGHQPKVAMRGLAAAASEVFASLLKARRDRGDVRELLLEQQGLCALCGTPIDAATAEADHVVPVHQAFYGQTQALQALCLECHRSKTFLETSHATSLESRFCRHVHETYACSPRLPPLVCGLAKCDPDRVCQGVDIVRCRKNALANAPFPLPVFCPLDNIRPAEEGHLADLTFVRKKEDRRAGLAGRLPYVGPGWYGKPATAFMLDTGLASWADFEWSLDATAHVSPDCLARALEIMEKAWPEGEEHMAKLAVNALIGLWARSKDVFYSMRTSNHEVDGRGCQYQQVFFDDRGQCHYDHVYATELFSNRSMRPAHDFVMASEYVEMARIHRALREVPPRYLVAMKTDCLVYQSLPRKFLHVAEALTRRRHRDNTPKYRFEEVKRLEGEYQEPRLETEPPTEQEPWRHVEDPVEHCLNGHSLLLSGMPGTGKTHLARQIVSHLSQLGEGVTLISKTYCSVQNLGLGAPGFCCSGTSDSCQPCRTPSAGPGAANAEGVPAAARPGGRLRARAHGEPAQRREDLPLPAVFEGRRGRAGAAAGRRAGGPRTVPHARAAGHLPGHLPRPSDGHQRPGEPAARSARAVLLEHRAQGPAGTNQLQTMRLWPGLRLVGAGGRVPKGCFVTVREAGERIVLDDGQSFTPAELLRSTRLCHAITYASCQGLTLRGRVWLCDTLNPHFSVKHLYVGASRCTGAELLSVL